MSKELSAAIPRVYRDAPDMPRRTRGSPHGVPPGAEYITVPGWSAGPGTWYRSIRSTGATTGTDRAYDEGLRAPRARAAQPGGLPKWPKGADCKSAAECFGGSNPSPATTPHPRGRVDEMGCGSRGLARVADHQVRSIPLPR